MTNTTTTTIATTSSSTNNNATSGGMDTVGSQEEVNSTMISFLSEQDMIATPSEHVRTALRCVALRCVALHWSRNEQKEKCSECVVTFPSKHALT